MDDQTKEKRRSLTAQILVGILGFILSIVLHEAFHIYMHRGYITHVELFPNLTTVVQIDTNLPPDYDLQSEEMVAYGITSLVIFITIMIIFKIRDTDDPRNAGQILFPKDSKMQKMNPSEMVKLSGLDEFGQPQPTDTPRHKTTKK